MSVYTTLLYFRYAKSKEKKKVRKVMKLEANKITKKFGKKVVITDASFTIENGVYGLLGPNGAGKTTLIRMLAGVMRPDSGEILFNGEKKKKNETSYADKIGYLPQDVDFYNDFSGLEYLRYVAALKGLPENIIEDKIAYLVDQVHLNDDINRRCVKYSGGMKKRLGIAQALLNDPEILILDEPTAGLDPYERIKFRNIISSFSADRTVILSTHIVSDIASISKEILLLKDHKVISGLSADDLTDKISDYVWEVTLPITEILEFQKRNVISNVKTMDNMACLRVVSETKPHPDAVNLIPDLEDSYLYEFNLKSKAS